MTKQSDLTELISMGHVGRAAEALNDLLPPINAGIEKYRGSELPYLLGSQAARDSTLAYATHVMNMLGGIGLYYGAILDTSSHLADIGLRAAREEVAPIYAPHSIARSAVELLAQIHWLLDPNLSAKERVARGLSIRRRDTFGAVAFGGDPNRLTHIDENADAIGLQKVRGDGARAAYEQVLPGYRLMVTEMLGDGLYSLLSGISHGEAWAILNLGYKRTNRPVWGGTGTTVEKKAPAYGLWLAITLVIRALVRAVPRDFDYRGWDLAELRPKLLAAHTRGLDLTVPPAASAE